MGRRGALAVAVFVATLAGCASTDFISTWADPNATLELQNDKVAVFVVTPNEGLRRGGEDALAAELGRRGLRAIAGYRLVETAQLNDKERLRQVLSQQGIQATMVMRILSARQEVTYVPGTAPFYGAYDGYRGYGWGYGLGMAYDPGYMTTDTVVSVETLVHSVPDGKLLWAGLSETVDPDQMNKMFKEIVDKATKEMKKQGLLAK